MYKNTNLLAHSIFHYFINDINFLMLSCIIYLCASMHCTLHSRITREYVICMKLCTCSCMIFQDKLIVIRNCWSLRAQIRQQEATCNSADPAPISLTTELAQGRQWFLVRIILPRKISAPCPFFSVISSFILTHSDIYQVTYKALIYIHFYHMKF